MGFFKNMFEQDENIEDHKIRSYITLNNPIIYILVGFDNKFEYIKNIIKKSYTNFFNPTKAIAYINFNDQKDSVTFNYELDAISKSFFTEHFERESLRRIYLVINLNTKLTEKFGTLISDLINFFDQNNNTLLIDVFNILDEINDNTNYIKHNIDIIESLQSNFNMTFLLSTLKSDMTLFDRDNIFTRLPYCSLVKDFSFLDNSFDEFNYIENAKTRNEHGFMFSFGFKKINKPTEIIKAIVLKEILNNQNLKQHNHDFEYVKSFLDDIFNDTNILFDEFYKKLDFNLISLSIDIDKQNQIYKNNKNAVNQIFGLSEDHANNLDLYFDINYERFLDDLINQLKNKTSDFLNTLIKNCNKDYNIGFYNTAECINYINENILSDLIFSYTKKLEDSKKVFHNFNTQTFMPFKHNTITLFSKVNKNVFSICTLYLEYLSLIKKNEQILNIIYSMKNKIENYLKDCNEIQEKIQTEIEYLKNYIDNNIQNKSAIITDNLESYYTEKTKQVILDHYDCYFKRIYKGLYEEGLKNIDLIFEQSNHFASKILNTTCFVQNLYNEIFDRMLIENTKITKEQAQNLVYDEIVNNKLYFSKLIVAQELYEKTCLITHDESLLNNFKNTNLEIFYDKNAEGLTILYLIGPFSKTNMFYNKKYWT